MEATKKRVEGAGGKPARDRRQGKPPEPVRASAFILVDDAGRERGRLAMGGQGPELVLSDSNWEPRVRVATLGDDGGIITLLDDGGRSRAFITQDGELGAALGLLDAHERQRVWIGLGDEGSPAIMLSDQKEMPRAELRLGKSGAPGLYFWDEKQTMIVILDQCEDGPSLRLSELDEMPKVGLAIDKHGRGIVWTAPEAPTLPVARPVTADDEFDPRRFTLPTDEAVDTHEATVPDATALPDGFAGRLPICTMLVAGTPVRAWVDDRDMEVTGRIVAAEELSCLVELDEPYNDRTLWTVPYADVRVRLCDLQGFVALPGADDDV